MKFGPVFAFTLFFALSAVILWGAWQTTEWLSRTCPTPLPTSIEVENFQPRSAEDGRKSADDSEHYASRKKAAANKFMPLVREVKTEEQKSETSEASPDTQREPSDWWAKFKCEVKATDVALATFTAMLVLVGSFQAYYLFGTVRATSVAANAALRQANAMVALESPLPSVIEMKLVGYANDTDTVGNIDPVPNGMPPNFCRPLVLLRNLGRTHMHLQAFCCDWLVSRNLPGEPPYQRIIPLNGALPGNSPPLWFVDLTNVIRLVDEERRAIQSGEMYLWVFGFISHLNFMRERSVIGYMARWDTSRGFVREPNQRYEYQT
jgi:hypothetical protein